MASRRSLIAAALGALLVGAAPLGAQTTPASPATLAPELLTVGLNLPSQGFQVGAIDGTAIVYARGFEVDLARLVARRMGLRGVRFVQEPAFANLVAPGAKRWDIGFGQVTATAGRRRAVSLSVPYLVSDQAVLLRRGLATPTPASLADLKPLTICVQRATTGASVAARRIAPTTRPRVFAELTDLLLALQAGRCDAAVSDAAILAVQRAASPERFGPLLGTIPTGERYAAVLPRGSALLGPTNRALNSLRRDGSIDRLVTRWLAGRNGDTPVIPSVSGPTPTTPVTPPVPPTPPVPLP